MSSDLPADVTTNTNLDAVPNVVVAFYTGHDALQADLKRLGDAVSPDRQIWIAWPKKTAGVDTDLTGDVVRATVLQTKLVGVKLCAISDTWSGLRIVWRKEHR